MHSSPDGMHSDSTPQLFCRDQSTPASSHNGDASSVPDDDLGSPSCDHNPEPPKELEDGALIDADNIGGTVFSKRWLFNTLMNLIRAIDKETENKEDVNKATDDGAIDLDDNLQDELCKLWDMSMNQEVVNFLAEYKAVDILTSVIAKSSAPRATEISVGILGNMACYDDPCASISQTEKLVQLLLDALQSSDAPTLVETTRCVNVCISNSQHSSYWLSAIKDHPSILNSILFIFNSSTNGQLLTNTASLVDQIMDTDWSLCQKWSTSDLISALLEAFKQAESESCQLYQELLHIVQLVSTTEEGVETILNFADSLMQICLRYLKFLCAEDVVALDGCQNAVASAISVLSSILPVWSGRDDLLTKDFQLLRCTLKILEIVYLKFHKLDLGLRNRSKSYCSDDVVHEENQSNRPEVIELSDSSSDDGSNDADDFKRQMIVMLYETVQSFILDVISALAELSETVAADSSLPKSYEYMNTMCDPLRIQYMIYTVQDFEGDTDGLIDGFKAAIQKMNLSRLAQMIDQSYKKAAKESS